jgi:hypothetical protein
MKTLVFFTLLTICNSDYFNKNEKAPTQWCVKMKCPDDGFGECTMVEVEASSQDEAYKKAKAKYPDCNKVNAFQKMNGKCTCN